MTPQMNILLTMKTGQRENGEIFINPFFMASEEKIKINFNVAKNIYKDIFRKLSPKTVIGNGKPAALS